MNLKDIAVDAIRYVFLEKNIISPHSVYTKLFSDSRAPLSRKYMSFCVLNSSEINRNRDLQHVNTNNAYAKESELGEKSDRYLEEIKKKFGFLVNSGDTVMIAKKELCLCSLFSRTVPHPLNEKPSERVSKISNYTISRGIGSCEMQSCVAHEYISDKYPNVEAEIVCLINYDHFFLVLSDNNGNKWVCDPLTWMGYPFSNIEDVMKMLVETKTIWKNSIFAKDDFSLLSVIKTTHTVANKNLHEVPSHIRNDELTMKR